MRPAAAVVAANLALFIGLTSLPAFRAAHHHWIFPIAAALLALEWLFLRGPARVAAAATMAVLMAVGLLRLESILACHERCGRKLGLAAAVMLAVAAGAAAAQRRPAAAETRTPAPPELAARLRGHVEALAGRIGERSAYRADKQAEARRYVAQTLKAAGYEPAERAYRTEGPPGETANVEAVLPGPGPAWIVGAHYDSASGTPGADDNASGVAVLLEAARLLKGMKARREVRFVAFGTEEPPAFLGPDMGSRHYALALKASKTPVHGMISLEMLGYYDPRPGSQSYPAPLRPFFPDHGGFVGVVSNLASAGLLRRFAASWRRHSGFPLEASVLPGPLADIAMSDQLNFWAQGFPALMLSDTAFYRNPHYHRESDTPETLDYARMAEVTAALAAVLAE